MDTPTEQEQEQDPGQGVAWSSPLRMTCEGVISGSGASSATCWLPCAGEWTALWVLASCCLMLS